MNKQSTVHYIDKSRKYYAAHGYETPYRWAHYDDTPFARLQKPLRDCTLTVVTTAMPDASYVGKNRRLAIGDLHNPPTALFTGELAWDQQATHTDDRESYLPIRELNRLVNAHQLGALAEKFYCVPTLYSARETIERDAPSIVDSCVQDGVDCALLVPL